MTLRDALAAALRDTGPDSPYLDGGEHDRQWADAILSDPAFRAALTEAVAEAVYREEDDAWCRGVESHREWAAAIVDRMLPAEVGK